MKGLAAFGGFALGVINLSLFLYKEYFRKGKLSASILFSEVRAVSSDTFDIQIDIDLHAFGGDVYLKRAYIEHETPVFDPIQEVGVQDVYKIINKVGYDILSSAEEDVFKNKLLDLFDESFYIANTKLVDKEHKVITIIDRIVVKKYMDGAWDWPLAGWSLTFKSSAKTLNVPFDFKVHKTSLNNYLIAK